MIAQRHGSNTSSSSSTSVVACRAAQQEQQQQVDTNQLVGEDAAAFDWSKQSLQSWGLFVALLSSVLGAMYVVSLVGGVAVVWSVVVAR